MKFALAGFAMAVFALTAIATATPAAADSEDDFLDALADGGISVPVGRDEAVVGAGHGVCRDWASGASFADGVADTALALAGNQGLARVFVRAATSNLCPEYTSELP